MLSQLVKSAAHKEETDSPSSHGKAKQRGALMPADALRAIAGQRAGMPEPEEKVADWDRIYWARMAKASPTLHICKALDKSVLELLDHLAALSAWRSDAFRERILPLRHFTTLSVICSQLCRAKADLGGNATKVVAQVRALLIESQRDEDLVVSRELQKRRNDPSMHLEEQIEKLTTQLQTTKTDFLTTRTARRWERLVLILEIRFLETRGNKLKKSEEKYITRIKASTTLKGLLAGAQEETAVKKGGGGKGGKGRGKTPKGKTGAHAGIPKTAMTMIKNEADRLEGREAAVLKQEERVMSQRDALRAAAADFEAEKDDILAEHQEVLRMQEEQETLAARLDKRSKDVEEKLRRGEDRLKTQRTQVEGKIPVLEALKESIQDRMVGLEIRSLSILHTFAEHQAAPVAKMAKEALEFAVASGVAAPISPEQWQAAGMASTPGAGPGGVASMKSPGASGQLGLAELLDRASGLESEERKALVDALRQMDPERRGVGTEDTDRVVRRGAADGGDEMGPAQQALMRGGKSPSQNMSPALRKSIRAVEGQPKIPERSESPFAKRLTSNLDSPNISPKATSAGGSELGLISRSGSTEEGAPAQGRRRVRKGDDPETGKLRAELEERRLDLEAREDQIERQREADERESQQRELAILKKERQIAVHEAEFHHKSRAQEKELKETEEGFRGELAAMTSRHAESTASIIALQKEVDKGLGDLERKADKLKVNRASDRALAEHLLAMLVPESTYAAQKPEVTGSEPEASRFENGVYVGAGAEAVQRGIEATSLVRDRVHRDNVLATDPRLTVWHLANLQRVYRAKIQALETEIAQRRKTGIGNLMPVPGSAALDSPDKKRRSEEADAVVDQAVDASVALQLAAAQDREHQDLLSAVGEVKAPLPHRKQVTIIAENPAPPSLAALPALGGLAGDSNPANNPLLGNNPPRRINTAPAWNDLMAQGHPRARGKSPAAAAPGGAGGAVNSGPGGNNIERVGSETAMSSQGKPPRDPSRGSTPGGEVPSRATTPQLVLPEIVNSKSRRGGVLY